MPYVYKFMALVSLIGLSSMPAVSAAPPSPKERCEAALSRLSSNVHPDALTWIPLFFDEYGHFFGNTEALAFARRIRKFGFRIGKDLAEKDLQFSKDFSAEVSNALGFLAFVRGNVKDLVWQNGLQSRKTLKKRGVDVNRLFNLFDSKKVWEALRQVVRKKLLKDQQISEMLDPELEWLTGYRYADLEKSSRLRTIYADEIVEALRIVLPKRLAKLPTGHPHRSSIEDLLKQFTSDQYGSQRFELTRRSMRDMKSGSCTGDCTAPGSSNYWTVPIWNGTFEHFELRSYVGNEPFARFEYIILENNGGSPVSYVHATEFNPKIGESRRTAVKRPEKWDDALYQQQLLTEAVAFLKSHMNSANIRHLEVNTDSNSDGFSAELQSFGSPSVKTLHLINGLRSTQKLHTMVSSRKKQDIPILIQGFDKADFDTPLPHKTQIPDLSLVEDNMTQWHTKFSNIENGRKAFGLVDELIRDTIERVRGSRQKFQGLFLNALPDHLRLLITDRDQQERIVSTIYDSPKPKKEFAVHKDIILEDLASLGIFPISTRELNEKWKKFPSREDFTRSLDKLYTTLKFANETLEGLDRSYTDKRWYEVALSARQGAFIRTPKKKIPPFKWQSLLE